MGGGQLGYEQSSGGQGDMFQPLHRDGSEQRSGDEQHRSPDLSTGSPLHVRLRSPCNAGIASSPCATLFSILTVMHSCNPVTGHLLMLPGECHSALITCWQQVVLTGKVSVGRTTAWCLGNTQRRPSRASPLAATAAALASAWACCSSSSRPPRPKASSSRCLLSPLGPSPAVAFCLHCSDPRGAVLLPVQSRMRGLAACRG